MPDPKLDGALDLIFDLRRQRDYMLDVSRTIAFEDDPIMRIRIFGELEEFLNLVKPETLFRVKQ